MTTPLLTLALGLALSAGNLAGAGSSTGVDAARATTRERDRPKPRERPRRPPQAARPSGPVTVPIDVGVGPVLMLPNPPAFRAQPLFTGLELSLAAIIDKQLIAAHRDQIPAGLRRAARGLSEVRYRPWFLALVPERVIISPQMLSYSPGQDFPTGTNTGMYGAVWRPFGLGVTLLDTQVLDVSLNGAVDLAYLFIHSTILGGGINGADSVTHFLRPGVNLALAVEIPVSDSLLISGGWSSDLFIPQPFGRSPLEIEPLDDSLWHLGGPFLQLHLRIPYRVNL